MGAFGKLLDAASDIAPTIVGTAAAAATGGNPAVGVLVKGIMSKVLGKGGNTVEEAATEILGDPEKIQQFRMEMRKAELEELRIRATDVQDARKTLTMSKGAVIVSAFVLTGYLAATATAMVIELPPGSRELAYLLLGNLGTGFGMVLTFWLGSSVGSKEKDAAMDRYVQAAQRDQQDKRSNRP